VDGYPRCIREFHHFIFIIYLFVEKIATIAEKAQVASYALAEIIVRNIQPHTIPETLILPACKQIVKSVLREAAERKICPLTPRNK
jgi:uncharacterized protein with PhoU and TrkA domain